MTPVTGYSKVTRRPLFERGACSRPLRLALLVLVLLAALASLAACSVDAAGQPQVSDGTLNVVAGENFWGSIAQQLGGSYVHVTTIVASPNADPHQYQTTTQTARTFAAAQYVILNGAGYDAWAQRVLDANPATGQRVLTVAKLLGKQNGDNPHFWYNPDYVKAVANQITHDYEALDPAHAHAFAQQNIRFLTVALKPYYQQLEKIRTRFAGTKVGATESIFVYLSTYLGLNLISPPTFMNAVAEGNDPPARTVAEFEQQISQKQIRVLVYNVQTSTDVTDTLRRLAAQQHIPTVGISETLQPVGASFQTWQVQQLRALQQALISAAPYR